MKIKKIQAPYVSFPNKFQPIYIYMLENKQNLYLVYTPK